MYFLCDFDKGYLLLKDDKRELVVRRQLLYAIRNFLNGATEFNAQPS